MSYSYQTADLSRSKAPFRWSVVLLNFKTANYYYYFSYKFVVLKFKTQLGLPFEGEIELADFKQLFIYTCRLYI